jgi:hypothetical protein
MGAQCCNNMNDSEEFIKDILSDSCLLNLTKTDINHLLYEHIHGGNDLVSVVNLEISEEVYNNIVEDIFKMYYLYYRRKKTKTYKKESSHKDIVKKFLEGLYTYLNVNNSTNCLIFKLIMTPFILNEKIDNEHKIDIFYENLKNVCFSKKITNYSAPFKYERFCETFNVYLAIILSGFTKIIYENITNEKDEFIKNDMNINLTYLFTGENIRIFYKKLAKELIKDLENSSGIEKIENCVVTRENFQRFCKKKIFLLNYFELRKRFITFITENENLMQKNLYQ